MSQKQQKIKTLLIRPLVSLKKIIWIQKDVPPPIEASFQDSPLLRYLQ